MSSYSEGRARLVRGHADLVGEPISAASAAWPVADRSAVLHWIEPRPEPEPGGRLGPIRDRAWLSIERPRPFSFAIDEARLFYADGAGHVVADPASTGRYRFAWLRELEEGARAEGAFEASWVEYPVHARRDWKRFGLTAPDHGALTRRALRLRTYVLHGRTFAWRLLIGEQ